MSPSADDVRRTVTQFLARVGKLDATFASDTPLYAGGVGLDSLETAELSATLEAAHGRDPYMDGPMPATLDDVLAFYAQGPTG
jgi:hypothetical protein